MEVMTHAPMPESLLRQMEALARSRHHESPIRVIERDAAEKVAREPKRSRGLYWMQERDAQD